jgi:hypothetical protein
VLIGLSGRPADAADPSPTQADTARLLGYMWADGSKDGSVWDVNGPSGTSTLIEYLVQQHGGTWVNRSKLQFRLPDPYDWDEWTDRIPDDSSDVRSAVKTQHFLSAVLEAEGSVDGVIYDQAADDGYTVGRLEGLRELIEDKGLGSVRREQWATPDRGQITLESSDFAKLRRTHRFVCPADGDSIRIPGGESYGTYGNLRWFTDANRWVGLVRNDCESGRAIADAPAPEGTCRATINDDGRVTVSWTYTRGGVSIRRNNNFVESVSVLDGSWSQTPANGTWSYDIRVTAGAAQAESSCGTVTTGQANDGPEPAPGTCVAESVGNGVQLRWADLDDTSYVVRKNGSWVETLSARSTVVSGSLNDLFVIRRRVDGDIVDVVCSAGDAVVGCVLTDVADGVRIDFEPNGIDRRIIRVNGNWLTTLDGATSYTHDGGDIDDDYLVRHRDGADRIDVSCG